MKRTHFIAILAALSVFFLNGCGCTASESVNPGTTIAPVPSTAPHVPSTTLPTTTMPIPEEMIPGTEDTIEPSNGADGGTVDPTNGANQTDQNRSGQNGRY